MPCCLEPWARTRRCDQASTGQAVSGSKVKNLKQSFVHKREQNHMVTQIAESERTAMAQKVTRQPDGPGKRIGVKGEITGIGKVAPGGAKLFRERLPQIQAEAGYWETRVGTVQELRVALIDNDTRILFTIVYDGDFKPYVQDFLTQAGPWLDQIFLGVWDGFRGHKDRASVNELLAFAFEADLFYARNPD